MFVDTNKIDFSKLHQRYVLTIFTSMIKRYNKIDWENHNRFYTDPCFENRNCLKNKLFSSEIVEFINNLVKQKTSINKI